MERKGRLIVFVVVLLVILLTGVIGYSIILDIDLVDALYMTVITISTVGYTEVARMNSEAKFFSIFMIFISLGTVGYLFSSIVSMLMEGNIKETLRRRFMEKKIREMKDHYIICGAGETGGNAIRRLLRSGAEFVVIEQKDEPVQELLEQNVLVIQGDATKDEILEKSGIRRARALISSLPKDADNVFVVLTARTMNSEIYIVARATSEASHAKLMRAGANNTISPNEIGGNRMAAMVLNPSIFSFLDVITHAGDEVYDLEDVLIQEGSELSGKTLKEARIPEKTGLILLALDQNQGDMHFNPAGSTLLETGDTMIVLGQRDNVNKLRELAKDQSGQIHH